MNKKILLFALIFISLFAMNFISAAVFSTNTTITSGLSNMAGASNPNIFNISGQWYMIAGKEDGTFSGWALASNGTTWIANSTITTGLNDTGDKSSSTFFQVGTNKYLITSGGSHFGYVWSGTGWTYNSTAHAGITAVATSMFPRAVSKDENMFLMTGIFAGTFLGYVWNGAGWTANTTIVNGFGDLGDFASASAVSINNTWYAFASECGTGCARTDYIRGYVWSGTAWVSNSTINESVIVGGSLNTGQLFLKDSSAYFVVGSIAGNFSGFVTTNYKPLEPTIVLNYPVNNYNSSNVTITFNISSFDSNPLGTITNLTLYIDGILNESNITSLSDGIYYFTKILSYGTHNWSVKATNNLNLSTTSATRTVNVGIFENSRTYSAAITEGSIAAYSINISTGSPVTSAYLSYNGTLYSSTITATADYTLLSNTLSSPSVSATSILPLFWVVYTSVANWNSTSSNQTVYNFNIDNCSINKLVFVNFTLYDEISQSKLNGSFENTTGRINLQIFPYADRTIFYDFATLMNKTNPFALCFNSTLFTGEKYSFDMEVEYTGDNYMKEFYHIQNQTLDNSYYNTNISLYPLGSSATAAKTFKIVYKDGSYRAVDDALIKIYRKYIEEGVFKTTEIPITDYNGETTASLQENNVVYSFYVYKYGALLSSFENVFVKCQYSSIDQCTLYLNAFSSGIDITDVEEVADFNFTLGYNKTTRVISSTFVIPSGTSHLISLVVTTSDALETSVCTNSLTSSSGVVSCVVPNTFGNSTITAKLYKDGVFQSYGNIKLDQDPSDIYGGLQIMLGLFMLLSLIGASVSGNPVIMIISFLVGVIALVSMNLISNNGFIGATASILFLIVAIIIVLIKIGRRN